jgi:hypothetical protein
MIDKKSWRRMVTIVPFLNFLETIGVLATMVFVITSMLGMGFSLTVSQNTPPLRNKGGNSPCYFGPDIVSGKRSGPSHEKGW